MKRSYKVDTIKRNIVEDPKYSLNVDEIVIKWWGFRPKIRKLLYSFPPSRYGGFR